MAFNTDMFRSEFRSDNYAPISEITHIAFSEKTDRYNSDMYGGATEDGDDQTEQELLKIFNKANAYRENVLARNSNNMNSTNIVGGQGQEKKRAPNPAFQVYLDISKEIKNQIQSASPEKQKKYATLRQPDLMKTASLIIKKLKESRNTTDITKIKDEALQKAKNPFEYLDEVLKSNSKSNGSSKGNYRGNSRSNYRDNSRSNYRSNRRGTGSSRRLTDEDKLRYSELNNDSDSYLSSRSNSRSLQSSRKKIDRRKQRGGAEDNEDGFIEDNEEDTYDTYRGMEIDYDFTENEEPETTGGSHQYNHIENRNYEDDVLSSEFEYKNIYGGNKDEIINDRFTETESLVEEFNMDRNRNHEPKNNDYMSNARRTYTRNDIHSRTNRFF